MGLDLAESFRQYEAQQKDRRWIAQLGDVARLAIWPWDLGNVQISIDDGMRSKRTIWIEFDKFPGLTFRYEFDQWLVLDELDFHAYLYEAMRQPLFNHLRYRPTLPVDDHIVLGED